MPTYKTNWASSDFINYNDWNRIESNILSLATYLQSIQYAVPTPVVVTNRTNSSIDYLSNINSIEDDIDTIRLAFMTPTGYLAKKTWTVGQGFSFDDANRLESNIQLLEQYGQLIVKSYRYCGAYTCGDQGGLY